MAEPRFRPMSVWISLLFNMLQSELLIPDPLHRIYSGLVSGKSPAPGTVPGTEMTLKNCIDCMGEKSWSLSKILKVHRYQCTGGQPPAFSGTPFPDLQNGQGPSSFLGPFSLWSFVSALGCAWQEGKLAKGKGSLPQPGIRLRALLGGRASEAPPAVGQAELVLCDLGWRQLGKNWRKEQEKSSKLFRPIGNESGCNMSKWDRPMAKTLKWSLPTP